MNHQWHIFYFHLLFLALLELIIKHLFYEKKEPQKLKITHA